MIVMEPSALRSVLGRVVIVLLLAGAGSCSLVCKSIESDNGDVIDCVDHDQQPALKHAAPAGNREIITNKMLVLASLAKPERSMKDIAAAANASKLPERHQTWRKHGSCPTGTVPIRRTSSRANPDQVAEQLARLSSPPFGRPGSRNLSATQPRCAGNYNASAMAAPPGGQVEVAAAYATDGPYLGARTDIPYWKINVHPGEFSMSYILVGYTLDKNYKAVPGGKPPAELTNQIAVGLVAWPSLYGDSLTRLFVYYTADGGKAQNCFNLDCGGFVVHNSSYVLGDSWADSDSQVGGERFGVTVGIHRGLSDEKWWVSVMDEDIGYYPETIFNTRFPEAVYVEMGGRVLNTRPGGNHTTTPMGSGMPVCAGSRFAATIMEYAGIDYEGVLFNDPVTQTIATTPSCYNARPIGFSTSRAGYSVSYGGPGGIYCDQKDS